MTNYTKNLIVGAAALWISVKDSTVVGFNDATTGATAVHIPSLTVSQPAGSFLDADTTNWRGLGFTSDGIELSYEPTFGEVNVDQLLDAAKMFKSGMKCSVKTTLAEATLSNLVVAWGQKAASLGLATATDPVDNDGEVQTPDLTTFGDQLSIGAGALYDEPVERSLIFIGPAPKSAAGLKRERLYHVRRALNVEASAHSLKKADATNIPVSLRLLPDPYYSGKEYGIIRDRNVA
jgi:hypothetical protein